MNVNPLLVAAVAPGPDGRSSVRTAVRPDGGQREFMIRQLAGNSYGVTTMSRGEKVASLPVRTDGRADERQLVRGSRA
jgi:hypothetical protein